MTATTATDINSNAAQEHKERPQPAIEMVLGGGGIKGLAHTGFLTAVEDLNIKYGKITGVSIGSMVAALYVNGYSPKQIEDIFHNELGQLNPSRLARSMMLPPRVERLVYRSKPFSLHEFMANLVKKYKLKPRPRLRIVAFNAVTMKPVVFQGLKYNLVDALTASCALPYLFSPVIHGDKGAARAIFDYWAKGEDGTVLFDGGLYHPYPGEFCKGRAIIAKLGYTQVPPPAHLPPVDRLLHRLEYSSKKYLKHRHRDPEGHLVIEVGHKEIATMTFNISAAQRKLLVDHAYAISKASLTQAVQTGEVPVKKRRSKKRP